MNKFGRGKEWGDNKWSECEDMRSVRSDNLGDNGQFRLWLPKKTFSDTADSVFIEGGAKQFGS